MKNIYIYFSFQNDYTIHITKIFHTLIHFQEVLF